MLIYRSDGFGGPWGGGVDPTGKGTLAAVFTFELIISFHCSVAGAMANLKDRLAIVFSKHTGPPHDDELVAFGKKHKGETFLEAWKDETWVTWTAEHLKPDGRDGPHTRWLEFVERQIKKIESQPTSGGAASARCPSSASGGGHDETEPPASGGGPAHPKRFSSTHRYSVWPRSLTGYQC